MARVFDVTAPNEIRLDAQGRGEVTFVATNVTSQPLRGRARLVPQDAAMLPWLTLAGEPERAIAPRLSDRFVVKVAVPPGTKAGQYNFLLELVSVANPDEDKTQGPNVAVSVTLAPPPPPPKLWIYVLAALAVLVVGGLIVYFLNGSTPPAKTASVSGLACAPTSLGPNAISLCTVSLTEAAPTGGLSVALASNNTALAAPASVLVPAGSVSGIFNLNAGTIPSNQSANVTATLGTSQSTAIGLVMPPPAAPVQISGMVCSPGAILQNTDSACMVTLTQAAPAGGVNIGLRTDNGLLTTVPSAIAVPAGGVAQPFTAVAAATVATNQPATITATMAGGNSQSFTVRIAPFFVKIIPREKYSFTRQK